MKSKVWRLFSNGKSCLMPFFFKNFTEMCRRNAMTFSLGLVKRKVTFTKGLLLDESVSVLIARLNIFTDFCLVAVYGNVNAEPYRSYSFGEDFHRWSSAPYHPARGLYGEGDHCICFRSGQSLGLIVNEEHSAFALVPWWWVSLEEGLIRCNNPFRACGESEDDFDASPVVVTENEISPRKKRGLLIQYIRYLLGDQCERISLPRKRR